MIPSTYYRSLLLPNEQETYKRIVKSLLRHQEQVQIDFRVNETETIRRVVCAVHMDHPEMVHVDFWHFQVITNIFMQGSTIQFHFLLDRSTFSSIMETIKRKVNSIAPKLNAEVSFQRRYIILMNEIAETTTYKNTNSAFWDHTAAGPILNHSAVCEGIAKLFLLYCQRMNMPCALVVGTLNGEAHAWNMVEINGNRCYVDLTAHLQNMHFYYKHSMLQRHLFKRKEDMIRFGYKWNNFDNRSGIS